MLKREVESYGLQLNLAAQIECRVLKLIVGRD